jgi:hypothetical protein
MSINLIVISRNPNSETYIDNIKSYEITSLNDTHIIYPNDTSYETGLILPVLNTDAYNLIIYDWSTSLLSKESIQNLLQEIMTKNSDVVYLGKYLDTCNKYQIQSNIENISLVRGSDPIGFNAILINPSFTVQLKNELESKTYYTISYAISVLNIENSINTLAVSPNMFVYNPLYNNIDSSKSYNIRTEECQGITSQITPPSDNNLNIFWILVIVIIVALLIYLSVNFTSFGKYWVEKTTSVQVVPGK